MVLFYCPHMGSLYQCISLRYYKHINDDAVLFVISHDFYKSNFAKKLIENNIFKNIILSRLGFSFGEESVEKQEEKINNWFENLLAKNNISLSDFSEIYTLSDCQGEWQVYLSLKNIQYTMIETSSHQFDNLARYSASEKVLVSLGVNHAYTLVLEKYKALCGSGDICKKRLRFDSSQANHAKFLPKDEWIDFDALFYNLAGEYKNIIAECLDKEIPLLQEKNICLYLTNSWGAYVSLAKLDIEHINLVNQLALDYYNHNDELRIFVKEHPHSPPDYSFYKYIEADGILNAFVPIEFYRFIPNFSINKLISVMTTALNKIGDCVKENIRLGASYYLYFRLCHKLFFAFSLHVKLNKGKTVCNWAKGVNAEFIHNFARYCFDDFPNYEPKMQFGWQSLKGDNFIIIDEVPPENKKDLIIGLEGADPLTKIVFLNSKKDFAFFALEHFDLLEYITPFAIKKTAVSDTCISDTDDEMLFFFCKDKVTRDAAKAFTVRKALKHTKLSLEISAVNIEDIYPSLLRLQDINRAFEAQNKRTSDVAEQVVKLAASQQTAYEDLSKSLNENKARVDALTNSYNTLNDRLTQTAEQLSGEIQQNETRTEERITQAVSEIKGLYRSLLMSDSWRIGQAVTWLPRKMSVLFRHK